MFHLLIPTLNIHEYPIYFKQDKGLDINKIYSNVKLGWTNRHPLLVYRLIYGFNGIFLWFSAQACNLHPECVRPRRTKKRNKQLAAWWGGAVRGKLIMWYRKPETKPKNLWMEDFSWENDQTISNYMLSACHVWLQEGICKTYTFGKHYRLRISWISSMHTSRMC
jgi:hypothetical protein